MKTPIVIVLLLRIISRPLPSWNFSRKLKHCWWANYVHVDAASRPVDVHQTARAASQWREGSPPRPELWANLRLTQFCTAAPTLCDAIQGPPATRTEESLWSATTPDMGEPPSDSSFTQLLSHWVLDRVTPSLRVLIRSPPGTNIKTGGSERTLRFWFSEARIMVTTIIYRH